MNDADDYAEPDAFTGSQRAEPGEVGLVEPHDFSTTEPFTFDDGQVLPGITLRYETCGHLNATHDNAILICHALSGDHHCAGIHTLADRKPGWWNNLIGPGKAVDTNRFFVLCCNVLGGCQGSSGPSSTNPRTGQPYGISFPVVTIRDMVRSQKIWLEGIGVRELYAVIGGSMGGMQGLQWGIEYPDYVKRIIAMATTARESAQAIAFNEVGRQAILQDPDWNHGNYGPGPGPGGGGGGGGSGGGPRVGLAIARMMAHITYLSDASMNRKFGRRQVHERAGPNQPAPVRAGAATAFDVQFEVESYLRYQGQAFINRFDANSYLYITRAIDQFDLAAAYGSLEDAFRKVKARMLVIGFTSDWLFPPDQNRRIAEAMLRSGGSASYAELTTDLGHDSFLLESPQLYDLVRGFLDNRA
ncbi:MAG: homoserine O-acetyltransferase [Opitutaceae bacterium]|jgi:homoserine O-acetyltransferase|nr:homoserine O-acetyltransferase [Opitutaceae bacterium]